MKRRRFLQTVPLDVLAAAASPSAVFGQHPGFAGSSADSPSGALRYGVEDGAITITNGGYFNNRPLYCAHGPAAVLGGDRPFLRLIQEHEVAGSLCVGLVRGGQGRWLHECDSIRMEYRCGHLLWRVSDSSFPGLGIVLEAVPFEGTAGFAARLKATGARDGDLLLWAFGCAHPERNAMWAFDPVLMAQDDGWTSRLSLVLKRGFEPDKCLGNVVTVKGGALEVAARAGGGKAVARCSAAGEWGTGDAGVQASLVEFLRSKAGARPLGFGVIGLGSAGAGVDWVVDTDGSSRLTFDSALSVARQVARQVAGRVVVKTPDPHLDAAVDAAQHAVDAIHYPPVFRHGCMAWNVRLPGWRTMFGATAFGWHERVREQAKFYLGTQVKEARYTAAEPEPKSRLCEQSARSRLNGLGRIPRDSGHYDFQSQFFDQLIHAWRWTGSTELESLLRDSLDLHAVWMRECFDPDGDGLYESYINTWPTDTVWYNGGGSVEESCYAYTTHRALADMARRAGDAVSAGKHRQTASHIQAALRRVLWLKDKGYYAAYVEQGGHKRVHEDAWLYSEFLPIDAGLTSFEEALQALHYCEWGLENVVPMSGGRRVWTSNWVPSKWSARELYHGDNYHLALAYFQSGLGEQGWEILRGNLLESGFAAVVPGSQSMAGAATDFGDILHPFCRAVVEGLFGYAPDLPNGVVRIRPGWPEQWPEASITTRDFTLRYRRGADVEHYELTLAQDAALEFRLPIRAERVSGVTCNGAPARWAAEAGSGCTLVTISAPTGSRFRVNVKVAGRLPSQSWLSVSGVQGTGIRLAAPRGTVVAVSDPHGVLLEPRTTGGEVRARLASKPGNHLVLLKVRIVDLEQWTVFRIHVTDPGGVARLAARTPHAAPANARWLCLELAGLCNGDVRGIFQQQYLSPRPATVSVRLGVDGYSPWTFAPWKIDPPVIDLSHMSSLTNGDGRIVTPQGVPFTAVAGDRNIAFTSLWDNWPATVSMPVGQAAEAVWLLVAGSTNPMQTRIANAAVRFRYADGVTETLDLVPPLNFWALCHLGGRDYSYERDAFCLPKQPPPTVQLGKNCRAMVLSWRLRQGVALESVTLEALSQEVVIGLMGVSLMKPDDSRRRNRG